MMTLLQAHVDATAELIYNRFKAGKLLVWDNLDLEFLARENGIEQSEFKALIEVRFGEICRERG